MEWTDLGTVPHFDPGASNADALCIEVAHLRKGMQRLNLALHTDGDATLVMCDDRPIGDPVYLPPPVRGYISIRSIVKLFANTSIDYLDVVNAVNDEVKANMAATAPSRQPANQSAGG